MLHPEASWIRLALFALLGLATGAGHLQAEGPLPASAAPWPSASTCGQDPYARLITSWNFDWDDNVFNMPTRIMVVRKRDGQERGISTRDFAIVRDRIGKPGPWADYTFGPESFRFFSDGPHGENYFKEHVQRAVRESPDGFKGPSFGAFAIAMSSARLASRTSIITARRQSPRAILEGLIWLRERGYIAHVPPVENIHAVGNTGDPAMAKTQIMLALLDALDRTPLPDDARAVTDRDGAGERRVHLWGFSDDDLGNIRTTEQELGARLREGRWPHVKITLFFTGTNQPGVAPHAEILTSHGIPRALLPQEQAQTFVLHAAHH